MLLLINFHQMGTNTVTPYPSISYDSNHESFIKHVDLFWTSQQLIEMYSIKQHTCMHFHLKHGALSLYIIIVHNVCIFLQLTKWLHCIIFSDFMQRQWQIFIPISAEQGVGKLAQQNNNSTD